MEKALRIMLFLDASFWLRLGVLTAMGLTDFGLDARGSLIIGGLAFANGVLLLLAAWRALRSHRFIDIAILMLLVVNAVLSVTDDMGTWDWVALVWNSVAILLLLWGMWRALDQPSKADQTDEPEA